MPKPKPHRSILKPFTQGIGWVWQRLKPIGQALHSLRRRLSQQIATNPRFVVVLGIMLLFLTVTLLGIVPSRQPFEGTLTVSDLSFTNSRYNGQLFRRVEGIRELTLAGSQRFTLAGSFSSQTNPQLNALSELAVDLPEETSQWLLTASDAQAPRLRLQELKLQPQTRIEQLAYSQYLDTTTKRTVRRLSLRIVPAPAGGDELVLSSGGTPLQITLSNYRLPRLSLPPSASSELSFTLDTPQIVLSIAKPLSLTFDLSAVDSQFFWGELAVEAVSFDQVVETTANFQNRYANSSIQSGTVRLPDQQLSLEKHQFLLINPPGITTLRRLEIVEPEPDKPPTLKISGQDIQVAEPAVGLSLEISGETNGIQAGLNRQLPVVRIQSSYLSRFLTKDQLTALISFSSAVVLSLLAWLVENLAKEPNQGSPPAPP